MENGLPHGLAIFYQQQQELKCRHACKKLSVKAKTVLVIKSKDCSIKNYISHFTTVMQILILKVTKSNM